jgi:hypothetical protein
MAARLATGDVWFGHGDICPSLPEWPVLGFIQSLKGRMPPLCRLTLAARKRRQVIDHDTTITHSSERFRALHQLAGEGHLEDPEKYAAIQEYLDIPHFIDYLVLNWNSGNLDWGFNNWFAAVQNPAGQVRYFVWDGERTWFEGRNL